MDWLGIQALAFGREVGELRFDSDALAEEIGLTVKLTRFRIEGKDWFDRAGQQAIYLPGQSFSVETSHFNGLLFNLCPQRLAETISEVTRHRVPLELAERWVQRPVSIDLADPR